MEKWVKLQTGLVVEVARVTEDAVLSISAWANDAQIVHEKDPVTNEELRGLNIETSSGMRRASNGDYVFKHAGEFFVSKPGRFTHDYGLLTKDTVMTIPVDPVELVYYNDEGEREVIGMAQLTEVGDEVRADMEVFGDSAKKKLLSGEFKASFPKEI